MSRGAITGAETPGSEQDFAFAQHENPTRFEDFGIAGPGSIAISTEKDPALRADVEALSASARDLRPVLREEQAATEHRGRYSERVHELFVDAGLYRMLQPRRFGGFEIGVSSFFQVISEVARGCPSTAWCLCLGSGHALQLASYWPVEVQEEVFGEHGYFIAPGSSTGGRDVVVEPVSGGYSVSGTWRYASGAPYSTHFLPTVTLPDVPQDSGPRRHWLIVPRSEFTVLDDWGAVIGMKGSGSNSIRIERAFVPDQRAVEVNWGHSLTGSTPGSIAHANSLYAGTFASFAEGEVSAVAVGLGYAALDEYERIIRTSPAPYARDGSLRVEHEDWRRVLGIAMGWIDSAAAISAHNGRLYEEYAARSVAGIEGFSTERSLRLSNSHFVIQRMVWDAVQSLLRTAGSSASADGARLQRYFRDIVATNTRTDQFEFGASAAASARVGAEGGVRKR